MLTEGGGVPIGLAIDGANRPDFELAEGTLGSIPVPRPEPTPEHPQHLCVDKGYDYDEVCGVALEEGYTLHLRTRGEEARELRRDLGHKPRRWVVERTHSWLNRFRRILIRWEKTWESALGFLHLACALVAYRAAGLLG